ncbi:MAG: hypothetical protein HXY40_00855 [Chloroflexi bacterium]|nr:hypothetical protein [Chloroflexota bacterium]
MKSKLLLTLVCLMGIVSGCLGSAPTPALVGGATVTPTPIPLRESVEPISSANIAHIENLGQLQNPDPITTVFAYALSPDSTRLAGLNNTLLLGWDLVTGQLLYTTDRAGATRVFYSPEKTELYTTDEVALVNVYSENGLFQNSFVGHNAYNPNIVAYQPEDGWLAFGGTDGTVKVWDTAARQSLVTIAAHEFYVNSLAFSPAGTLLASGGDERVVNVWDWQTRTRLLQITLDAIPTRLLFSPDGAQLAVGTQNDIRLYNTADGTLQHTLATGNRGVTEVMLYDPNGRYLVNGGGIANMQIWDPATGMLVGQIPGFGNARLSADFSPDGSTMITSMVGGGVALWDLTQITDETVRRADLPVGVTTTLMVDWTDDGRLMVMLDAVGTISVWGISPRGAVPTETPAP